MSRARVLFTEGFRTYYLDLPRGFRLRRVRETSSNTVLGVTVADLAYVALTLVVFGVLFLILKGIERFER
jgi:hypothetical protein